MKIVVLTTGHRPDDDRVYFKEVASLLTRYPRVDLIAPADAGQTYAIDAGTVLHPLARRRGVWGRLAASSLSAGVLLFYKERGF